MSPTCTSLQHKHEQPASSSTMEPAGEGATRKSSSAASASLSSSSSSLSVSSVSSSLSNAKMAPQAPLARKRSSIQSDTSSLPAANSSGSGHGSLQSSGSAATSAEDNEDRPGCSSAAYERIRNTTLLFFLDRLYLASREGKEARTLHDLSCLFGTKEFTKDMRQIVGSSRNGLKKFLQSYPSLFQVEGDKVHLSQLSQGAAASQRDYNREAVEYFKMKLLQFGTSLVPIKNLFGCRSQASQEVRHVSGKDGRDFKRFLRQNEHVFEIIADEHVVLKSALAELESQGQSSLSLERSLQSADAAVLADPYLNKQLAHQIEHQIRAMRREQLAASARPNSAHEEQEMADNFRVTLETLLERIRAHCQNELFLDMVKSHEDLKVFLRMHPKLFKRFTCEQGRDWVSLLSEQERNELELAAKAQHQSMLLRQNSAPERSHTVCATERPPGCDQQQEAHEVGPQPPPTASWKSNHNHNHNHNNNNNDAKDQQYQRPPAKSQNNQNHRHSESRASLASQQLRAAAPPFVPSRPGRQNSSLAATGRSVADQIHNLHQRPGCEQAPMQRSRSNLASRSLRGGASPASNDVRRPAPAEPAAGRAPIDQRQAIRSYLLKGNQPSHHNLNWAQHCHQRQQQLQLQQECAGLSERPAPADSDSEMRARTVVIVREASNIITRIMATTDAVAFDCKGYNLGFDGQITLIQFGYLPTRSADPMRSFEMRAGQEGDQERQLERQQQQQQRRPSDEARKKPEVCVFDLITNPELAYCLKPLLESDKIVKIVHDVRNKSNALYAQFKIILNNVFDTQVANLVIQQQGTGKPAYKSRHISMSKMCEIYGDEELMKYRNLIKCRTRHGSQLAGSHSAPSGSSRASKGANYWLARPLTRPMIFEATMDVYCLVGGIYRNLRARIKPEYEPLFEQLNLEGVFARIKPEEIRIAKKARKIDLEVIDLKRKLYSNSTGSVVLSNREIRLLRHIDLTEEVRQKIQQCKKVAKKLERLDMKAAQLREERAGPHSLTSNSQLSSIANAGAAAADDDDDDHDDDDDDDRHLQSADCASLAPSERQLQEQAAFASKMDEFQATGMMTNLMDSSMFDELKDKMIESSNLLESLEDDNDDAGIGGVHLSSGSQHSHNGSLEHDCCGCQCHKSSIDSGVAAPSSELAGKTDASPPAGAMPAATAETATAGTAEKMLKSAQSTEPLKQTPEPINGSDKNENDDAESKSSLACDMAVQCDLLS